MRRVAIALALLVAIATVFYSEEDLRGWLAWKACRQALQAEGARLDWSDYIPPPVPDYQNFFKAPKMQEWFVRREGQGTNELTQLLKPQAAPVTVANFIIMPASSSSNAGSDDTDLVLRYSSFGSALFGNSGVPAGMNCSVISMVDVPITTVIENLAKQAGIKYTLDPKIGYNLPDGHGSTKPEPTVSVRWENIAGRPALLALLNQYNLQLVEDSKTGQNLITAKDSGAPSIYADAATRQKFQKALQVPLQKFIGANTIAPQGFILFTNALPDIKPVRIILYSEKMPDQREIYALFKQFVPDAVLPLYSLTLGVQRDQTNSWRIVLSAQSAAEYLSRSDKLAPAFNLIREALKRRYARMDGDYSNPSKMPAANFIAVRMLTQTIAGRAESDLLLGRTDSALQELTLLHDLCRMLEAAPSGKPMTLVAAMIAGAVNAIYVNIIAGGLQSHAWSEPQLAALQQQLAEINLTPLLLQAFQEEPAGACRMLQTMPVSKWANGNFSYLEKRSVKVRDWLFDWIWPRGWDYQNMVNMAMFYQKWQQGFDPANNLILPRKLDEAARQIEAFDHSASYGTPYKILAAIAIPNFKHATQTAAHNQTRVNEAQIACALERYHLANGAYPENLEALVPEFIKKMPPDLMGGEPLQYRRAFGGNFLLYSVGWNEADDDGTPGKDWFDPEGDWVWGGQI